MILPARPFRSLRQKYGENLRSSSQTYASAAYLAGPDGDAPAVALFRRNYFIGVLTQDDALRLSNELVDCVEALPHNLEKEA